MLLNLLAFWCLRVSDFQQYIDSFLFQSSIHQGVFFFNRANQHADNLTLGEAIVFLIFQTIQNVTESVWVVTEKSLQEK